MVLSNHNELVCWIQNMPSYYETDSQIFVHAGIDEEAGEDWMWGTSDDIFLWKYLASKGKFCKTIIAGHVSTGVLANDDQFHDVFYDGESHYYIDGSVYKKDGKFLLLAYDEDKDKYYQIEGNKRGRVKKFEAFQ